MSAETPCVTFRVEVRRLRQAIAEREAQRRRQAVRLYRRRAASRVIVVRARVGMTPSGQRVEFWPTR